LLEFEGLRESKDDRAEDATPQGSEDLAEVPSRKGFCGMAECKILTDLQHLAVVREVLVPGLESEPDTIDLLCSIPFVPPTFQRCLLTSALEEVVEEQCWDEDDGEDDNDEGDLKSMKNAEAGVMQNLDLGAEEDCEPEGKTKSAAGLKRQERRQKRLKS